MTTNNGKSYRYTKQGLNLKIISGGVSKTHIIEFLRTIPTKHMKRLDTLFFVDRLPEGKIGHEWEAKRNDRGYYAVYYRLYSGEMNIGIYITRDFLAAINKNRMWVSMIRRAILHELAHHLVDVSGKNHLYPEREMEDFVDRYTERHSNMKVLLFKSPATIRKYDMVWDEIERTV